MTKFLNKYIVYISDQEYFTDSFTELAFSEEEAIRNVAKREDLLDRAHLIGNYKIIYPIQFRINDKEINK